ncbi:MAG: hypothetical protein HY554_08910, partial [Elusimicrobia bacterium]|nr:hypothetical protein [Elusimicrobiota bacterium]
MTKFTFARAMSLALALLLGLAPGLQSAAPALMTYQGRLKEAGIPVTGARDVELFLCPTLTGGSCSGTGAQGVSVANGLFRSTFSLPAGVSLETGNWYLQVKVGSQILSPREQFTASPYALHAASAATLVAEPDAFSAHVSTNLTVAGSLGVGGYLTVLSSINATAFFGDGSGLTGVSGAQPAGSTLADGKIWIGNASNNAAPVALGGDATLANDGTLTIGPAKVTEGKLADGAVTMVKLANLSVDSGKLAAGSVDVEKLAEDAVDTGKIRSDSIVTAKLADGA